MQMEIVNHSKHRELQSEILKETISILQNDDRVLGIILGGSYAREQNDAFLG